MAGALSEIGVEEVVEVYTELDGGHVFLVANLADGVFRVDVPPGAYETGAGYVWRKRDGARLLPENVNSPPPEGGGFRPSALVEGAGRCRHFSLSASSPCLVQRALRTATTVRPRGAWVR